MPSLESLGRVHFIAIGGAGMSVIARMMAERGLTVQGSDGADSPILRALADAGIRTWVGHDPAQIEGADTVVVSSAIRPENPELRAARAAGIPILHRSEALAALMEGQRAVAVAGAHGKTTTTAMIVALLRAAGLDPSFAIGGTYRTADGALPGGHVGASDILVAEADESDASFLNYRPTVAVVTNVEPDHLDHYGSREAFEQAFVDFAARLRPGGLLIACHDDPGAIALAERHRAAGGRVVTYGTDPAADLVLTDVTASDAKLTVAEVSSPITSRNPGRHNLLNLTAAVAAVMELGVPLADAAAATAAFVGTGRRYELRGEAGGVKVIDDYAHHPTEVAALLNAARAASPSGRILVLFQPHLYSRTKNFAAEFAAALALADHAVVTGIYRAREDVDPSVTASTIVDLDQTGRLEAIEDRLESARAIAALARAGDTIFTVGAGDVTDLAEPILDVLSA